MSFSIYVHQHKAQILLQEYLYFCYYPISLYNLLILDRQLWQAYYNQFYILILFYFFNAFYFPLIHQILILILKTDLVLQKIIEILHHRHCQVLLAILRFIFFQIFIFIILAIFYKAE